MKETKPDLKIKIDEAHRRLAVIEAMERIQGNQSNQVIANLIIEALGEERASEVADEIKEL